jgi:hypothetical protein
MCVGRRDPVEGSIIPWFIMGGFIWKQYPAHLVFLWIVGLICGGVLFVALHGGSEEFFQDAGQSVTEMAHEASDRLSQGTEKVRAAAEGAGQRVTDLANIPATR